jgi:hypothetical protein
MNEEKNNMNESNGLKDAKEKLTDAYNDWSAGLGVYSVQAAYAIIAANWAVHAKPDSILSNRYATWSIFTCIAFISINIFMVWRITEMHYDRISDAEKDNNWWLKEYENRNHTKFPYTQEIESWSKFLRKLKGLAPIAAGTLFLFSLFFS